MTGDLHCHSIKSDGSLSPSAIVSLAQRLSLQCVAVTDHDTMDGCIEAATRGSKIGVRVIPGLEVSSFDYLHGKKVHILCYFPKNPEPLLSMCRQTLKKRTEASLAMAEKISSRYPVTSEIVKSYASKSTAVYKQHITLALMDMGYSLSVFGDLYRSLFSSNGGWALIQTHLPDTRDALRVVKDTGGAAVLAHPGVYGNFDIIDELCALGLDGIEVNHPRQSQEDTRRANEAALRYGLIRTGGSDFHGMIASRVTPLGTKTVEPSELDKLIEHFGK